TRYRSHVRRVEEAVAANDIEAAQAAVKAAEPIIAKTAQAGVIHQNAAARKISRLYKRVKAMSADASV
ncbi:MAG: 30S ribosomal protein S20, partial [Pseudomonadota bacterium]